MFWKIFKYLISILMEKTDNDSFISNLEEEFSENINMHGITKAKFIFAKQTLISFPPILIYYYQKRLDMLKHYIKFSLRNIMRNKIHSILNILGLSVGMACSILIFLFISYEMSYDIHINDHNSKYRLISDTSTRNGSVKTAFTPAPWAPEMKNSMSNIEEVTRIWRYREATYTESENNKYNENEFFWADNSVFEMFSIELVKGDLDSPLSKPRTIVINEETAKRYFANDDPIGKIITFAGEIDLEVTAVMGKLNGKSHFNPDFIATFITFANEWYTPIIDNWNIPLYYTYVKLSQNSKPQDIENSIPVFLYKHMDKEDADRYDVSLQAIREIHLTSGIENNISAAIDRKYIYIFGVLAFLILGIALINFMNLTTAKASQRVKEIGLKKVFGSKRSQLIFQFLGESTVLSFFGLFVALILIKLSIPILNDITGLTLSFQAINTTKYWGMLVLLGITVGISAGIYPSFILSSFKPVDVFIKNKNTNSGLNTKRVFLFLQFSATIFMLVATGIINNQFNYIQNKNLGFDKDNLVNISFNNDALMEKYELYKNAILRESEIESATATSHILGGAMYTSTYTVSGLTEEPKVIAAHRIEGDFDYIKTYGIEIIGGRGFSKEYSSDAENNFMISEYGMNQLGIENPEDILGKTIHYVNTANNVDRTGEIIGVFSDVNTKSLYQGISPMIIHMDPNRYHYLTVKIAPNSLAKGLEKLESKWNEFSDNSPFVFTIQDEFLTNQYKSEKLMGNLFVLFTGLSLFVSCLGLVGMTMLTADQKTKEIGIRKILGASNESIIWMLTKEFTKIIILANIIAWPVSYIFANDWLSNFSYKIEIDSFIFFESAIIVYLIALLIIVLQSIKVVMQNPTKALRCE